MKRLKPFKFSVAVHIETIHLICKTNEIAGFYMKCKTELKWHKRFHEGEIIHYKKCKKDFFYIQFYRDDDNLHESINLHTIKFPFDTPHF